MNSLSPTGEKCQKVLAHLGIASRRACEVLIQEGRVSIDGRLATLGDRVGPTAVIAVDGKVVAGQTVKTLNVPEIILYYKPEGEMCSHSDPQGRPLIFENLPKPTTGRWVMVGRLDYNSSGLLLLTNQGEIAHQLMHPSFGREREYHVRALGDISNKDLARLTSGIECDGEILKVKQITCTESYTSNRWYTVILEEGKNREIRRLFEAVNTSVSRLIRIRYGNILLPRGMKPGQWMPVPIKSIKGLNL